MVKPTDKPDEEASGEGSGDSGEAVQSERKRIIVAGQEHRFEMRNDDYFVDADGNETEYASGKSLVEAQELKESRATAGMRAASNAKQPPRPVPSTIISEPVHVAMLAAAPHRHKD